MAAAPFDWMQLFTDALCMQLVLWGDLPNPLVLVDLESTLALACAAKALQQQVWDALAAPPVPRIFAPTPCITLTPWRTAEPRDALVHALFDRVPTLATFHVAHWASALSYSSFSHVWQENILH